MTEKTAAQAYFESKDPHDQLFFGSAECAAAELRGLGLEVRQFGDAYRCGRFEFYQADDGVVAFFDYAARLSEVNAPRTMKRKQ